MSRANNGLTVTLNKVGKFLSNADQPTLVVLVLVIVLAFVFGRQNSSAGNHSLGHAQQCQR